ncbi:fructose6-phosphate 2-kinase/fructose-2,6-bisphosphatase [Acanthamoeba castellanii str. Neff]|uniref:Fructose6-phosphate 2-kinase/fructose-2,6-bisphosphatase n=1 Tax=Acanthamoeba castellanii (strain ATCC 30010 / Neff) TaxID=1257118 RepID=L8GPZ2_ACACF|nr:fructose6-phosphate 2-kinase/fructose-2,6-bisphosphatase [Acanthamoeba castellanii str. Neff]ELR14181.1 fructose6-phosphate 2-kinase/fructose-2,6-bisphosphatase [Acanthamoeba castellanii str. Neff]
MEKTVSYNGAEDNLMKLTVWTSTLQRAIATSQRKIQLRCLDEIDAGKCDGMTYEEIAKKMPEEFAARAAEEEDVIQVPFTRSRSLTALYAYVKEKLAGECPHVGVHLPPPRGDD